MAARAIAALAFVGSTQQVAGHGWVSNPPARNHQSSSKNGNCPHCGNGNGICGDGNQWPSGSDYVNFYNGPVETWSEGSIVAVEVRITAHHKGHYEFSLCDKVINSALPNAQSCLDKHVLERASAQEVGITDCQPNDSRAVCQPLDSRHRERFYLPPGSSYDKIYLKLPQGVTCDACTMQWRWWSANSCTPATDYKCFAEELAGAGYSTSAWGLEGWDSKCPGGGCDRCGCGEEFRNCVDVSIQGGGGASTTPSSTTVPATTSSFLPVTTSTTTRTEEVPTTPATTSMPSRCVAVPVDGEALGATDENCNAACALLAEGQWPCTMDGPCKCDASASTTTPAAITMTTTATSGTGACGECTGPNACVWTDGKCYPVAKDACQSTDGATWCGSS
eukprot:TRINITY_DN5347_c0_g3_i1.p1 TRINITY_DN5347_c0_g3~~TRINITY_DN5347_c0_g3_i1.p1  ORF type:complete len:416 (-),score=51.67 TRINITY_DN5347_c0_g3_i1:307-1482(-)